MFTLVLFSLAIPHKTTFAQQAEQGIASVYGKSGKQKYFLFFIFFPKFQWKSNALCLKMCSLSYFLFAHAGTVPITFDGNFIFRRL